MFEKTVFYPSFGRFDTPEPDDKKDKRDSPQAEYNPSGQRACVLV